MAGSVGVAKRRDDGGCADITRGVDGLASIVEGVFSGSAEGVQALRQQIDSIAGGCLRIAATWGNLPGGTGAPACDWRLSKARASAAATSKSNAANFISLTSLQSTRNDSDQRR